MKELFKKTGRLFYFILALVIGLTVTYGISKVSDKSKGPLTTILDKAESAVFKVEQKITLDKRGKQRINKLQWFHEFKENKEKLIQPDFILLGASDDSKKNSYETIINLEDSLNTTFPLIHIFAAWGSKPEHQFPTEEVQAIHGLGSIPVITWEPWVTGFDGEEFKLPPVEERMVKSMLSIAYGTYDLYIKKWALKAKQYGHPIYIRLGHEMNDPYRYPWGPMYNKPEYFVRAWQHIHDIFTYMGADNVIWVWSPHLAYNRIEEYYPGDKYVDIVATGVLNYGNLTTWSKWYSFDEIFGYHYDEIAQFNKPIMIAEFGSLNSGGDKSKWFADALHDLPKKYPAVMSVIFFHYARDYSISDRVANWYIKDDEKTTQSIKNEFKSLLKYKRNPIK